MARRLTLSRTPPNEKCPAPKETGAGETGNGKSRAGKAAGIREIIGIPSAILNSTLGGLKRGVVHAGQNAGARRKRQLKVLVFAGKRGAPRNAVHDAPPHKQTEKATPLR
jgi:hypothetical protein